ncbi:hypothetical protein [Sulfidibacter corallicola]|uniref:Uncharacterized protein n=1 Tax=Sulfidibacter corallicola TaxID=2818388 RepID=A0A8A4TMT8_SULCO|nr:hypothetical protein [Sulfidibacter corallicola]QTD50228.1 hypothetical protein J3U87_31975 [Sulfidibacter corallicola]
MEWIFDGRLLQANVLGLRLLTRLRGFPLEKTCRGGLGGCENGVERSGELNRVKFAHQQRLVEDETAADLFRTIQSRMVNPS